MRRLVLAIAFLLLPAVCSAQQPWSYSGYRYQYRSPSYSSWRPTPWGGSNYYSTGPRGFSWQGTRPNAWGGFDTYGYGPQQPRFVQPLPTPAPTAGWGWW